MCSCTIVLFLSSSLTFSYTRIATDPEHLAGEGPLLQILVEQLCCLYESNKRRSSRTQISHLVVSLTGIYVSRPDVQKDGTKILRAIDAYLRIGSSDDMLDELLKRCSVFEGQNDEGFLFGVLLPLLFPLIDLGHRHDDLEALAPAIQSIFLVWAKLLGPRPEKIEGILGLQRWHCRCSPCKTAIGLLKATACQTSMIRNLSSQEVQHVDENIKTYFPEDVTTVAQDTSINVRALYMLTSSKF